MPDLIPEEQPAKESQPVNIAQPEPENMEVHYEPHFKNGRHKKHLKEYLKEFLMIFFAVFLGFLAESLREHIAEGGREKEYIKGFATDLKQDSVSLSSVIAFYDKTLTGIDSLIVIGKQQKDDELSRLEFYRLVRKNLSGYLGVTTRDVTMQQIKNSADWKLIKKHSIADSLALYYMSAQITNDQFSNVRDILIKDIDVLMRQLFDPYILFDKEVLKNNQTETPPFNDALKLRFFFSSLIEYKYTIRVYKTMVKADLEHVKNLRRHLAKVYNLDNIKDE